MREFSCSKDRLSLWLSTLEDATSGLKWGPRPLAELVLSLDTMRPVRAKLGTPLFGGIFDDSAAAFLCGTGELAVDGTPSSLFGVLAVPLAMCVVFAGTVDRGGVGDAAEAAAPVPRAILSIRFFRRSLSLGGSSPIMLSTLFPVC